MTPLQIRALCAAEILALDPADWGPLFPYLLQWARANVHADAVEKFCAFFDDETRKKKEPIT